MPEPLPPIQTPEPISVPEPAPTPEPTPVPEPTPTPASAPTPEPTSAPETAQNPEPVSNPEPAPTQPAPEPAPTETSTEPKKKLSGSAIAGIIIAGIIVLAGIVIGVLSATNVIDWSKILSGVGFGGGLFQNDPTPTVSLAESTCKNHGGTISDLTDMVKESSSSEYTPDVLSAYECEFEGSESESSDAIEFEFILIDGDIIEYFKGSEESIPSGANILENSDEMIKFIDYYSENVVEYIVLYKNAEVILYARNNDTAERALVELGFPDRSKASGSNGSNSSSNNQIEVIDNNTDTTKQRTLYNYKKVSLLEDALIEYQTNNMGALPIITPDYDDSDVEFELDVTGYESTPANQFYNDYLGEDFVDYDGNEYHLLMYADYEGSYYDRNPDDLKRRHSSEMTVFYNSKCTASGVAASSNPRSFAIVIVDPTNELGIYCVDNG